jgi:hypothetical protein
MATGTATRSKSALRRQQAELCGFDPDNSEFWKWWCQLADKARKMLVRASRLPANGPKCSKLVVQVHVA